VIHQLCGPLIT